MSNELWKLIKNEGLATLDLQGIAQSSCLDIKGVETRCNWFIVNPIKLRFKKKVWRRVNNDWWVELADRGKSFDTERVGIRNQRDLEKTGSHEPRELVNKSKTFGIKE